MGCSALSRFLVGVAAILLATQAAANRCKDMEHQGHLISQQLKRTKVCTESKITRGWTDCHFQAGATEIVLAGAIGLDPASRAYGLLGGGFSVLALDPGMTARPMFHDKLGMVLRLDSKNETTEEGCDYDQAYITLDAQVLDNADLTEVEHPELSTSPTPAERVQSLQKALRLLGYDPGPEDGKEGPKLTAALAAYRRNKKLDARASEDDVRRLVLLEAAVKSMDQLGEAVKKLEPK
jgi:hypothetical protein